MRDTLLPGQKGPDVPFPSASEEILRVLSNFDWRSLEKYHVTASSLHNLISQPQHKSHFYITEVTSLSAR